MKKSCFLLMSFAVCAGEALADYSISGGGDIVSKEVTPDQHATRILFGGSGATWTLSADYTIHSGGYAETGSLGNPKTVKFDFTDGNHTLKLQSGNFLVYNHDVAVDFLGGTWDFNGNSFTAYNAAGNNNRVTMDACRFINVGNTFAGLSGTNYWWQLKNGSSCTLTSGTFYAFAGTSCAGSLIELSGGSTMTGTRDFAMHSSSRTGEPTDYLGVTFRVTGEGSSFSHGGCSFMMGQGYNGEVFEVASNATAVIGYPRIGYSAATRNTGFYVHDKATFTVYSRDLTFGASGDTIDPTIGHMFLRVVDATAKMGNASGLNIVLGSENNELFLSNATFRCAALRVGEAVGGTGNVVRILGPQTDFTGSLARLFGNGGNGLVEFGDRANVTVNNIKFDNAPSTDYQSASNVLRVTGGALLSAGNVSLGESGGARATDNRIEITDGGKLYTSGSVSLMGTNNCLIVDNGTLEVAYNTFDSQGRDTSGVFVGRDYSTSKSDGCKLIIRGDHPKVKIPKTSLNINCNARLRFELPPNGYAYAAADEAPMELLQIMNYTMDYEIAGLDELQKNLRKSTDIPLIRMSERMWDGQSAFDAINRINAKLAETNPGCYLWKQNNRQTTGGEIIYLHVKAFPGLILIFR